MTLTGVIGGDVEQTRLEELRLLSGSVEGGDHDRLATAALAEDSNVLLKCASLHLHPYDGSSIEWLMSVTAED
jgi:hypothetical protein